MLFKWKIFFFKQLLKFNFYTKYKAVCRDTCSFMYFKDITIYILQKSKGGKGKGHGAKTPREPKEPREPVNEKGYKVRGYVKGQTCKRCAHLTPFASLLVFNIVDICVKCCIDICLNWYRKLLNLGQNAFDKRKHGQPFVLILIAAH